jgi:hypothetical protein
VVLNRSCSHLQPSRALTSLSLSLSLSPLSLSLSHLSLSLSLSRHAGCYFNPRGGKKGIFRRDLDVDHKEFPAAWFAGLPPTMYIK